MPIPGFPNTGDVTICGPDSVLMMSAPGANATIDRWYDSLTGGTMLTEDNNYLTPYLTATHRYFVSSYNSLTHCESSRRDVQAIILPTPGPNPILGPSQVGIGQTNVIYSVNFHSGSTYNWSVPPGVTVLLENQNFIIVEFPNLGTYNLSVVETNSIGCVGPPNVKQVTVKDVVILLDMNTRDGNACAGDDLQIIVTPSGGTPSYTFTWTGDIQYLSANGISDPYFNSAIPGQYLLIISVADINGNISADTVHVTVHPNPVAEIAVPDSVVCAGYSLPLNTTVSGGSGIYTRYLWTGATSSLSATDIPDPRFQSLVRGEL